MSTGRPVIKVRVRDKDLGTVDDEILAEAELALEGASGRLEVNPLIRTLTQSLAFILALYPSPSPSPSPSPLTLHPHPFTDPSPEP